MACHRQARVRGPRCSLSLHVAEVLPASAPTSPSMFGSPRHSVKVAAHSLFKLLSSFFCLRMKDCREVVFERSILHTESESLAGSCCQMLSGVLWRALYEYI